jgi:threonine/homoserine/homoserine lactone efflux protein
VTAENSGRIGSAPQGAQKMHTGRVTVAFGLPPRSQTENTRQPVIVFVTTKPLPVATFGADDGDEGVSMSGSWGSVLVELIPLALIVALSPLSIIPAVLVLHSPRPRPTGLAFLAGWIIGLFALAAIFLEVSSLIGGLGKPPSWASWLRIVIGAALIVFGIFRWFTRDRAHTPGWMRTLTTISPTRAVGTAAALVVINPKVLFVCAAAGLAIGTAGLGAAGAWTAVVSYTLIAASSVAIPVLAYAFSGDRLDGALARLKDWMERHNATLVAAILVVIGLLVLYKGIHGL